MIRAPSQKKDKVICIGFCQVIFVDQNSMPWDPFITDEKSGIFLFFVSRMFVPRIDVAELANKS